MKPSIYIFFKQTILKISTNFLKNSTIATLKPSFHSSVQTSLIPILLASQYSIAKRILQQFKSSLCGKLHSTETSLYTPLSNLFKPYPTVLYIYIHPMWWPKFNTLYEQLLRNDTWKNRGLPPPRTTPGGQNSIPKSQPGVDHSGINIFPVDRRHRASAHK